MKDLKLRFWKFFNKYWPIFIISGVVLFFFYPVWLKGLVPIPSDFIVGVYYPWLDYKWLGYLAGVPVKNPLLADIPSLIYPLRIYAMQLLSTGVLPLWNPLQFGGYPLMATFQAAVFFPLNILYFFLDHVSAWTIQVILQPFLATLFTYLFLRQLKISKIASLLGGLTFAFSGFNLIWLEYNIHAHVAAFIPVVLLLVEKLVKTNRLSWGVLLSLSVGVQIFAGYPQVTFYTLVLASFWFLFRLSSGIFSKKGIFLTIKFVLFVCLGLTLASTQIIPGIELLRLSQRLVEGVTGGSELAYLPPRQLISLFAPDFFGNPSTYNYWGPGDYTNTVGYTGIITIILAGFALFVVKKREVKFFLFVAFISLVFALPTPISYAVFGSGFLGLGAATATRVLVLFNFSLAILSGYGFNVYEGKINLKCAIRTVYLPISVLLGVGLGTIVAWKWLSFSIREITEYPEALKVITPWVSNLKVSLRNLILPIGLTIGVAFLIVIKSKFNNLKHLAILGLFVLLVFELLRFGWKYNPFSEKEFLYPSTPVFDFLLTQDQLFRIEGGDVIPISMWIPFGLESPSGYDAIYPVRWAKFLSVMNTGNPKAAPMGRYGSVDNYDNSLFDLTNTKYILALKRDSISSPDSKGKPDYIFDLEKFKPVFEDKTVVVFENKDAQPRAFFVNQWEQGKEDEILSKLLEKDFPLAEKIILEDNPYDNKSTIKPKSTVRYKAYESQKSNLEIETNLSGFLVVTEAWYPGWKVFVDGRKEELLRADYVFRAVAIPEGRHSVEFIYDPESFKIGQWATFTSLLVLIAIFIYGQTVEKRLKIARKRSS